MDVFPVNWDSVPEVMNKEQFFRICHISKSTALHLLKSGKVPCEWSGKKTRCYKIRKEDVKAYLEERAIFPELYSAPKGWYGTHYVARLSKELPEDTLRQMHGYYEKLLRKYPDVVTVKDVVYYNLLTTGTLDGHLADIEEQAQGLFLRLVEQYADSEGVTERLKASEPQSWVRKMNGIRHRANEIVMQEIVYG